MITWLVFAVGCLVGYAWGLHKGTTIDKAAKEQFAAIIEASQAEVLEDAKLVRREPLYEFTPDDEDRKFRVVKKNERF